MHIHTERITPMAEEPTRDGVIESFRPIAYVLDEIVAAAQEGSSEDLVRAAHPPLARHAHRRRLMGALRWMLASDTLVSRISDGPIGFGCLTTEADHNQGRYAFSFPGRPGGVFMIRRTPHEPGEGEYVQERLEGVLESAPLAEQFKHSPLKVYLSIPANGGARLIAEHPAWPERQYIALVELHRVASLVTVPSPGTAPRPAIRSTRAAERVEDQTDERTS
jgi:hypothetical protein